MLWSYWTTLDCWVLPSVSIACNWKCLILALVECWYTWMPEHCSVHILMRCRQSLSWWYLLELKTLNSCDRGIEGRWILVVFVQHAWVLGAEDFAVGHFSSSMSLLLWLRYNHTVEFVWTGSLSVVTVRLQARYFCWFLITVSTQWLFRRHGLVHELFLSICCSKCEIQSFWILTLPTRSQIPCCIIFSRAHLIMKSNWCLLLTNLSWVLIVCHCCCCVIVCLAELWVSHCFLPLYQMLLYFKVINFVSEWPLHRAITWSYHRKLFQTSSISCIWVLEILSILWMTCWVI